MYALETRSANYVARRFARDAADGLIIPGRKAAITAALLLSELKDAGADDADIQQLRDVLHDVFGNVQGRISTILDNEGVTDQQHQIDLSEVL